MLFYLKGKPLDCSNNPTELPPCYPGDIFEVTEAGKYQGINVEKGDAIIASCNPIVIQDFFREDKNRVDNFNLKLLNTQTNMKVTDLKENELISCASEAERVRIASLLHKSGLKWCNGDSYLRPIKVARYPFYYYPKHSIASIHSIGYVVHDSTKFRNEEPSMQKVFDDLMREFGFEKEVTSATTGVYESSQEARPFVQTSNGTITGENIKITTDQPHAQSDFNMDVYRYTLSALLEDGVIPEKAVGIALVAGRKANDPESII